MIKYYKNNYFPIFWKKNFLSKEEFYILKNSFPKFKSVDLIKKDNEKYSFNSKSETFLNLIKKEENLNILLKKIKKRIIKIIFLERLFLRILKERNYSIKLIVQFILHLCKIKQYFDFSLEFSYISNHGAITPHLDGRKKLISLMLYFPDNLSSEELNKKQKKIGTKFYFNDKLASHKNIHLNDKNIIEIINNKSNFYQIPFLDKHLFGFIKNNRSWHAVEKIEIDENYIRKSINININLI